MSTNDQPPQDGPYGSREQPAPGASSPPPSYPGNQDYPTYPANQEYPTYPGNQGYPSYPQGGTPPPAGPQAEQPQSMRTAVLLMRVGAALSLLGLILSLATMGSLKDDIRTQLEKNDTNVTASELDTVYNTTIAFAIIVGVIGIGLWLWMAWANGRGKKWARVVATVLGGLGILSFLYSMTAGQSTTAALIVTVVTVIVDVVTLVLIWRQESTDYYTAMSQPQLR
ncbi:MAG: hypothetical protein ACRDQA_18190 [Nocardioidaceae bacterium]